LLLLGCGELGNIYKGLYFSFWLRLNREKLKIRKMEIYEIRKLARTELNDNASSLDNYLRTYVRAKNWTSDDLQIYVSEAERMFRTSPLVSEEYHTRIDIFKRVVSGELEGRVE
jgi:hypothetical protein